ncbi:MAG: hypothetical protein QF807_07670 [Candidatus Thalassarchaeaceae archaeon]|nr:hypothetical protein [Candidatus Thalassarchaeaceae archaeon]MDP7043877.1 hypothetical protein [Candidatus Thalassarchaeaceae archaeon]
MNQEAEDYKSATPIDTKFKGQFKAWRVIAFMRWITFIIGPVAIIIDDYLQPWVASMGLPNILTIEDLSQWLILDILNLKKWIDAELFLAIYYHVNWVSCILFIVFVVWHAVLKRKTTAAARDLTLLEEKMRAGI